ncbi:MAG: hypothetical protein LKJ73_10035 [Oscillospiraceae bacterium]|jgi:septal ring factor EnvC (AmiA/AmiB activator)|nr:hypothetical protein [Oscillospiraceae bacterium]
MPRGKRKTLEEQIADVDQQISKLTELKKNLEEQKRQEDVQKLLDAAKKSGLTPEELVQKLSEKV